jgi:hypothetical protein
MGLEKYSHKTQSTTPSGVEIDYLRILYPESKKAEHNANPEGV